MENKKIEETAMKALMEALEETSEELKADFKKSLAELAKENKGDRKDRNMKTIINLTPHHVNVLGTVYLIKFKTLEEDLKLENCNAYVDPTVKKIVIKKIREDRNTLEDLNVYYKYLIKHELVHAFIYESGLNYNSEWAENEEMVSWIALQFDKIAKAFDEIKIKGEDNETRTN